MGQYWTMKNLDKRESLSTNKFGAGLKYMERWFSGSLYTALMLLLTDVSSLGDGGGDFCLEEVPAELKQLIQQVLGSWAGDRIVFSGDYTKNDDYKEEDGDGFEDIADKTALALWTMVACNMIESDETYTNMKEKLLKFLKKEVCGYTTWERDSTVKSLLATIETLFSSAEDVEEAEEVEVEAEAEEKGQASSSVSTMPSAKKAKKAK